MAKNAQELFKIMDDAKAEGVTMNEKGRRGNIVKQKNYRKRKVISDRDARFQRLQSAGRIWWDN